MGDGTTRIDVGVHAGLAKAGARPQPSANPVPLCVDLDGTLVKTNVLLESLLALLKANVLYAFLFPLWLVRGRAYFKREIARRVRLDPSTLPYNLPFLNYLKEQRARGRSLVLATACDGLLAQAIARHLGLFEQVLVSDGLTNLSGRQKLKALNARFRRAGFDYAGNARVDLPIWRAARASIVVNAPAAVARAARSRARVALSFDGPSARERALAFVRALRPHQWVKNLLVFVPLLAAHLGGGTDLAAAVTAFIAFCLCSSGVYLLNDMLDLEADRAHATKRHRPFASGALPLAAGIAGAPLLLLAAAAIALSLSPAFLGALAGYFALTLAYSFYFKRIVLLDVVVLAVLYTVRIFAGALAVHVAVSKWLFAFSVFLFLSLAFVKRFSELFGVREAKQASVKGRSYYASDLEQLATLGASSGYISVLVLALYINSEQVTDLYRHPGALWFICLVLLYWVSRVWLLAHRGQMHHDPIVFAIKDRVSYLLALAAAVALLFAL